MTRWITPQIFSPLLAIGSMLASLSASGQDAAGPHDNSISDSADGVASLALGDGCAVSVHRGKLQQRYEGAFVQATDQWIVLRQRSEGRNEYAVPVLSKLPWVGNRFRNVAIGREDELLWIPRAVATVVGHIPKSQLMGSDGGDINVPRGRAPAIGAPCTLIVIDQDQAIEHVGDYKGLAGGELTIAHEECEVQRNPIRGWSRIPLLGAIFYSDDCVTSEVRQQFPLDDVLCVRVPVERPFDTDAATSPPSLDGR